MRKKKKKKDSERKKNDFVSVTRTPKAIPHQKLANESVHVFVDDQNLFWGIVNETYGHDFRLDFGSLLMVAARRSDGSARGVSTAFIAGVIPDDDSFWRTAESQGFKVLRGFMGQGKRSKQDDAFLIAEMVSTIYEEKGPSTIVLVAGDADYGPALKKVVEKGWRVEVVFEAMSTGVSAALEKYAHEFRAVKAIDFARDRQIEETWIRI